MDIIIIEDEKPAAKKLRELLLSIDPTIEIHAEIESVKEALQWFSNHKLPDLIITDIELLDGNVFTLFEQINITCPIIFTTSFDHFLLEAFKVNSIAYLLKPFDAGQLNTALIKYDQLKKTISLALFKELGSLYKNMHFEFKTRFVVKMGNGIYLLETNKIVFLQIKNGIVFAYDEKLKPYPLNENLLELETILDPKRFFRINRSEIININYIEKIQAEANDCISIKLNSIEKWFSVSISRAPMLREWLNR